MQVDWELSQQFVSDSQGVRAACVLPSANSDVDAYRIVTGNQGGGLCEFGVPSASLRPIEYQHNHSVTALLTIDELEVYVTGCKDAIVRVFDYSHQLQGTLKGHEKPVTSLSLVKSGDGTPYLVTGSWDGTAKLWDLGRQAMLATLPDHENSVCVTGLMADSAAAAPHVVHIATGSAGVAQNNQVQDHTVRIWTVNVQTGQVTCTASVANDHEGSIRGIASLNEYIGTCSNDGTVRLRTRDTGDSIATLTFLQQNTQHPPMLLSVTSIVDDGATSVAASAEDGHVVVWTQGEDGGSIQEPQVIMHPSCVWNVVGLPKGDLATCCQDGTLRIFTKASDRMAPQDEKEAFSKAVQEASQKKSSGPSAEEVAKLPLWEQNLQKRGTSEGQVQIFNKNGTAIAAQWSMASQTWIEVGQVMGSADGGTIDGVQYDHVLPIEVDQTGGGVAKLQIGYNNGENPFVAAQRFIDAYMLPQYHLNDIADYIQQRVGDQARILGGAPTSTSSAPAAATTGIPMINYQHLPMRSYKSFELPAKTATSTLEKMKKKIEEIARLSDTQLALVSSLIETLGATSRYHSSKIQPDELNVILDMLEILPLSDAFPALDLARLTVAHPDAASSNNASFWNKVMTKALSMCDDTSSSPEGPAAVAIPMLSLRLFANAFRGGPGSQQVVLDLLESVLQCNEKLLGSGNKNIRLSAATLLYNVAYYQHSQQAVSPVVASQVVVQVDTILKNKAYETEALIRGLVALGTTVMSNPEAKETAKSLFVVSRVEMAASPHGDTAKTVAKEVYHVLS